jgi:hypothetical protein
MTTDSFAAQERAALEALPRAVSTILAEPVVRPAAEQSPQPSPFSPAERSELMRRIVSTEEKASALIKAYVSTAARSGEAARKAAAWGIVSTIVMAILLAMVPVVVTVWTSGSAMVGIAGVISQLSSFLTGAAGAGHPLAGELAAILKQMATALGDFSRERERDSRAAVTRLLDEVDRAVTGLERLPARVATITGPCQGDRGAVFEACSSLEGAIARFDGVLRQVPPRELDTTSLIAALGTVGRTLADSVPTIALKT